MGVPIRRFDSMESLVFDVSGPARYIVEDPRHSLPLDVLFIPRPGSKSKRLLVGLHGAEGRATANLPKFQFVKSFTKRDESLLFIADSTLLQGEKINIGWYAGNSDTPLQILAAQAVNRAGEALGVTETVLIGHSAGGFGAIMIGKRVPNSRAISVNGQSVVDRYLPWTVKNLLTYAFPDCSDITDMMSRFKDRLDLRVGLLDRLQSSTFTYFGNKADEASFGKMPHFPLLAEYFGLGDGGGITKHGDALVACENWALPGRGGGHAMPGTAIPFIALTLGEGEPTVPIPHSVSPLWTRR